MHFELPPKGGCVGVGEIISIFMPIVNMWYKSISKSHKYSHVTNPVKIKYREPIQQE